MPITQALSTKGNIKKFTNSDVPFSANQPIINSFYQTSTAGQTAIANLGFSVSTLSTGLTDNFWLFVDGKKLTLGASNDYVFSSIAADGSSSSISFNYPIAIGLNIQAYKMGLTAQSDIGFSTDNRFTTAYEYLDKAFQGFINQSTLMSATATTGTPVAGTFYSSVSGRAAIIDLTQDLGVRMSFERVMTQSIFPIQNEVGPANEPVWGVQNDFLGRIRFVGGGWTNNIDVSGSYISSSIANSFVEVTFYGTGLTALIMQHITQDVRASVDGGAEGANITSVGSAILNARNYAQNQIIPVAAGLTLGVHTVKLRLNSGGTIIHGFEIHNESSSVKVQPGIGYIKGQKATLAAQSVTAYNSLFETGTLGTRGGRALVYQKSDGTIGKAVNPAGSQLNLTAADHSNEEMFRQINVREFGAARTDDFSTIGTSASSRAFTLDDNTTTLTASSMALDSSAAFKEGLVPAQTSGSYFNLTFVGTGLDIYNASTGVNTSTWTILVDNTAIVTNGASSTFSPNQWVKIVSGLQYGTHTIQVHVGTTVGSAPRLSDFRLYQPKKPTLPTGAIELADYNILANYAVNSSVTNEAVSAGILRKTNVREWNYQGTWTISSVDPINYINGFETFTGTNGSFFEYTFFGTGFEMRGRSNTSWTATSTLALQSLSTGGSLLTLNSTNFAGLTTTSFGGFTYTYASGNLSLAGSNANGSGMSISGLPLGLYKIRLTNGTANNMSIDTIDVITPIYSQKSNSLVDLNNSLFVGSNGISDNRKITPVKDSVVSDKAWSVATDLANNPTITAAALVPMPDMTAPIFLKKAGALHITGVCTVTNSASNGCSLQIYVDGVPAGKSSFTYAGSAGQASSEQALVVTTSLPVAAGAHLVQLYWASSSGGTSQVERRTLTVKEN